MDLPLRVVFPFVQGTEQKVRVARRRDPDLVDDLFGQYRCEFTSSLGKDPIASLDIHRHGSEHGSRHSKVWGDCGD